MACFGWLLKLFPVAARCMLLSDQFRAWARLVAAAVAVWVAVFWVLCDVQGSVLCGGFDLGGGRWMLTDAERRESGILGCL